MPGGDIGDGDSRILVFPEIKPTKGILVPVVSIALRHDSDKTRVEIVNVLTDSAQMSGWYSHLETSSSGKTIQFALHERMMGPALWGFVFENESVRHMTDEELFALTVEGELGQALMKRVSSPP